MPIPFPNLILVLAMTTGEVTQRLAQVMILVMAVSFLSGVTVIIGSALAFRRLSSSFRCCAVACRRHSNACSTVRKTLKQIRNSPTGSAGATPLNG